MKVIHSLTGIRGTTECSALELGARWIYTPLLFLFPGRCDSQRLWRALAIVLDDFPELAGKLVTSGHRMSILHDAAGVRVDHKHCDLTIAQVLSLVRSGRTQMFEANASVLRIARGREAPTVVRLTEARDGWALALSWNHAIGDMQSMMLLLRAWADVYSGRPHQKPICVPDRDAFLREVMPAPVAVPSALELVSWPKALASRVAMLWPSRVVNLEFSLAQLAALQQGREVSVNDALCAHVYVMLRRLAGATTPRNLGLVVNFRKRLGLSEQLFGNMATLLVQPVRAGDEPSDVAASLRQRLSDYATQHVDYHATMRVLEACAQRDRLISRQFLPGSGDILISNWNGFGIYDLAFDAMKPLWFCPIARNAFQLPRWMMIVYELPARAGLMVAVGLPPKLRERVASPAGQALVTGRCSS